MDEHAGTKNLAARVMLLALGVGLFVAAWSGDGRRRAPRPGRDRSVTQRPVRRTSPPRRSIGQLQMLHRRDVLTADSAGLQTAAMVVSRTLDRSSFLLSASLSGGMMPRTPAAHAALAPDWLSRCPLPGEITPGEFHIACSDGRAGRLRITSEELIRRGIPMVEKPRPLYLLHDGRVRWYFIRVEPPEENSSWAQHGGGRAANPMTWWTPGVRRFFATIRTHRFTQACKDLSARLAVRYRQAVRLTCRGAVLGTSRFGTWLQPWLRLSAEPQAPLR